MLRIESQKENGLVVIQLAGKFDITELQNFENIFLNYLEKKPSILAINLKDLNYIDSSGIGSLIRCMNMALKNNTEFLCYDISKNVYEIFKLAKLDQFIPILTNEEFRKKYPKK